ncbi:hypothetical protein [Paracoccus sp. SSJ]|uniref:hypothetical protein n=1 Tax=Paracoccus sp. SSJ TaxID=3050636 RepID=UPI00254A3CBD|nr:hypothetical protein [Paracoccus sp. SSJ]MDK8874359.1 hypothetical protein [Paracoccus sp. SSJ]
MQVTHDNDCEHRIGHDCTCGASNYLYDLAAARAEIGRLTKGRDQWRNACLDANQSELMLRKRVELAEAERDEAWAQVAAAYAYGWQHGNHPDASAMPTVYEAALEAYGREKVREGMRQAVDLYPQGIAAILAAMEKEGGE